MSSALPAVLTALIAMAAGFLPTLSSAIAAPLTVWLVDALKRSSERLDEAPAWVKQLVVLVVAPALTALAQSVSAALGVPVPTSLAGLTTQTLAPLVSIVLALLLKRGQQYANAKAGVIADVASAAAAPVVLPTRLPPDLAAALAAGDDPGPDARTAPPDPAAAATSPAAATIGGVLGQMVQRRVDATPAHEIAGALGGLLSVLFPPAAGAIGLVERGVDAVDAAVRARGGVTIAASDAGPGVPAFDPQRQQAPAVVAAAIATPGPIAPAGNPAGYLVGADGQVLP